MIDSNQTLRFIRTSREAFGYQAQFDDSWAGRLHAIEAGIIAVCVFAAGVLMGVLL